MKIKQRIKRAFISVSTLLVIILPSISVANMGIVAAQGCDTSVGQINNGVNTVYDTPGNCSTPTGGSQSLAQISKTVVNIFSLIVGIVAVIMIIYGGFRYITSGGESGAVGNAKNTIIYAIIGLVLVALAQTLVHFVLDAAINGTVSSSS